jgi:hypothetical protein
VKKLYILAGASLPVVLFVTTWDTLQERANDPDLGVAPSTLGIWGALLWSAPLAIGIWLGIVLVCFVVGGIFRKFGRIRTGRGDGNCNS